MLQGKAIGTLETQRIQTRSNTGTGAPPGDTTAERFEPCPGALESTGKADVPRVNCGRLRVMVADDHEMLRNILVRLLLEEADIEVIGVASNGTEAVRLARMLEPDVIIMDVAMPEINGIEATRRIKSERPTTHIIGFTMNSGPESSTAICAAGANACVSKSGTMEQLLAAVRCGAHSPVSAHLGRTLDRNCLTVGSE